MPTFYFLPRSLHVHCRLHTVLVPIHWFLTLKLCIVRKMKANYNHEQKLGYFWITEAFSNSHIPRPSPHPTNNIGRMFPEFFPSSLLKDRVLICRDAIKRSILAQYLMPYFKADISLFPTGDRLTQISPYISLLHHDWQSRVAKFEIKKEPTEYLFHLFTSTKATISTWQSTRP